VLRLFVLFSHWLSVYIIMCLQIDLPEIRSSKAITLDIGEDCIVLNTRSLLYSLHIYLPYSFVQTECGAQFDKQSKKLSITLPVVPQQAVS